MFTCNSISETLDSKHFEDPEKKKKKLLLSTNTFADLKTQLPNEAKYKNFVLPTYFSGTNWSLPPPALPEGGSFDDADEGKPAPDN
ncbi:hypothetical protein PRIPAC_97797 [Pristionchus pacificus]|uniref:Uncharacterized protein n=1 Tax=Pristionchus pacificus TaxID=54126 RepID=A0A2A6CUT4_PRIPA|nr:hypothetical protein PRIPAC_97797 [Pristionchus pacificus]|eukprot:PDM81919.1 hypothetical protein PRIPAC_34073 [Pristionchus pacificus]